MSPVKALCDELSVEFYVVKTDIGRISLEKSKNQASPCSWCAKLRKGALNDFALSVGCNKVAYAHHMDDIIETMFLSLLYEGQFLFFRACYTAGRQWACHHPSAYVCRRV